MPSTEKEVGISEFLCDHKPFQAILKQTIDDFLVNEVAADGTVVYQRVLGLPELPRKVAESPKEPESAGKLDETPLVDSADKVPGKSTVMENESDSILEKDREMKEGKPEDAEMKRESSKDEKMKSDVERKEEDMKVEIKSIDADTKKEGSEDEEMGTEVKDTKEVKALITGSKEVQMEMKESKVDDEIKADVKEEGNNREANQGTNGLVSDTKKIAETNAGHEVSSPWVMESADLAALDLLFADSSPAPSIGLKEKLLLEDKFLLPVQTDKAARTKAHQWVRENLKGYFSRTMKPDSGEQCVEIVKTGKVKDGWKRRDKRSEQAKKDPLWVDRKDVVQCTLWKRGRDTMETLNEISRFFRLRPGQLSTAGTKDKRGITVQRLRVRGMSVRKLVNINKARPSHFRGSRCFGLGDFEILRGRQAKPLTLGDLAGNRFTLVLRGISQEIPREQIVHALDNVEKYGFVNYFGMQRFGSGEVPTHETGFSLLRGDYKEAIMKILSPLKIKPIRQGDTINSTRMATEDGLRDFKAGKIKATRLVSILPRWMHIERTIVRSLCEDEVNERALNYKKAFSKLQKNMKTMYIHAVQSYLWNCMASETIGERKCREFAKEGDLISCSETLTHTTAVRSVTEEEEMAKSVPLSKVILPIIGTKVTCGTMGNKVKGILEEQKLEAKKMFEEYEDNFKGTYRKLLSIPGDFKYEFKHYPEGSRSPLVSESVGSEPEKKNGGDKRVLDGHNDNGEAGEKRRKMSVEMEDATAEATSQGGERKDAAGDADVEMKESGAVDVAPLSEKSEKPDDDGNEKEGEKKKMDLALIVSFSLGTSSYATMMIRELTRCPTDTKYHKNLTIQQQVQAASKAQGENRVE